MLLSYREMGEGDPLVVLHGLFGAGQNWLSLARRLADHRRVVLVDARNHGSSPHRESSGYPAMADDLRKLLDHLAVGETDLLGHSMGGKTAMWFALEHFARVRRLIVADIAPVAYQHSHLPLIDAMLGIDLGQIGDRKEVDEVLANTVPEHGLRQFLLTNLVREDGRFRWRLNLPVLRDGMAQLLTFPVVEAGVHFAGPTLFVHGGKSDYVTAAMHPEIEVLFPMAEFQVLPGAGHWLHAERPGEFSEIVNKFFEI